jgi:hypothetical protein
MRAIPVGLRFDVSPIAPVPEATTHIEAGPVTFGVEYRILTDEEVDAAIPAELRESAGIDDARPAGGLQDEGVSVHVFDSGSRDEFLRFDSFGDDPHYHYIFPGSHNIVVGFDVAALGDFHDWTFSRLRLRLPDMLREAGQPELADQVVLRAEDVARGIDEVEERVRQIRAGVAGASAS